MDGDHPAAQRRETATAASRHCRVSCSMRLSIIFVVLCILTYGRSQKSSNDDAEPAPFEIVDEPGDEVIIAHLTDDNMVEVDDMLMTREQFNELFKPAVERFGKRVAIAGSRWPNGVVPYAFAADLKVNKTVIRAAMNEWEKHTCVRFIPKRPTDKDHVVIRASPDKCSSAVGWNGNVQYINLAKNCETIPVLLHELGHTLGLLHEHQHPNRDKHIKILWSNIPVASRHSFELQPPNNVVTFGLPYDPTSIMHYEVMGAKNCPSCNTIQALNPALVNVMGQAKTLSPKSDIPIVKKMYCGV